MAPVSLRALRSPQSSTLVHALLYTRVSGAEHQKQGLSLVAQIDAVRRYAARPGWITGPEYEYQDIMSGRKPKRPGYQAMLEHARRLHRGGERVAIIVVRLDRFGRNKAEYFRAADELEKQGAEVHSVRDGGVLEDTHAGILAVFAAKEAKMIGQRVGETRSRLVNDGWHYGRVPFGYRHREATLEEVAAGKARKPVTPGTVARVFEPDPLTRGVVVEAFERAAGGESVNSVAKWLGSLPESLRGGRSWPANCVDGPRGLLRSPTYVARPAEGVDDVLARPVTKWEPLVSDDVWRAVQIRLSHGATFQRQAKRTYLLSGFLRCPECGIRWVATSNLRKDQKNEHWRMRYRCSGYARGANAPKVNCLASAPVRPVDQAVLDQVCALLDTIADPQHRPGLLKMWLAADRPSLDATRVAELERGIDKLNNRLARATEMWMDDKLDNVSFNALRDDHVRTISAMEAELQRLRASAQNVTRLPSAHAVFDQAGGWAAMLRQVDIESQRKVLDRLVDSIVITRRGYRQYDAAITWTPLGQRLFDAMEALKAA